MGIGTHQFGLFTILRAFNKSKVLFGEAFILLCYIFIIKLTFNYMHLNYCKLTEDRNHICSLGKQKSIPGCQFKSYCWALHILITAIKRPTSIRLLTGFNTVSLCTAWVCVCVWYANVPFYKQGVGQDTHISNEAWELWSWNAAASSSENNESPTDIKAEA